MVLIKLRKKSQLTLPAKMARSLKLKEGGYLDCLLFKEYILLLPTTMEKNYRQILQIPTFPPFLTRPLQILNS